MIRKTLPESRITIPQILAEQRRPIITIIMLTVSVSLALALLTIRGDLPRVRMKGIQETLDGRCRFVEKGVVRVSRFDDRPDLDLCDEDAQVLQDFRSREAWWVARVLF